MNRDRDHRGRFSKQGNRSTNLQTSFRLSNASNFRSSPTQWTYTLSPRGRGRNAANTTISGNKFPCTQPGIASTVLNSRDKFPYSQSNRCNSTGDRQLPPLPSSPPPHHTTTTGMTSSSGTTQISSENQNNELNSNSPQKQSLEKNSSKDNNTPAHSEGEEETDNTPLTAATLEAVIAKSMSKVFGKLDVLSKDVKKVQESQAATAKLAGEVNQVKKEVQRMDESVRSLHQLAMDNSSRHDSLFEEVCKLQAQVRGHQSGDMELLKIKAFSLRNNLIIEGIPELSEISEEEAKTILTTDDQVMSFFQKILGISQLDIDSMYRLGKPRQDSTSARPIMVKFQRPRDRESVWQARSLLNNKENSRLRIKEDLPLKLRPIAAVLHKIAQQARRFPKTYRNVMVRDFQIHVNGKAFSPTQLENLPKKLRPSYTSTPGNLEAVAFYGRHSIFSNHYACTFMVGDTIYNSIEQFLAHRRATIAGDHDLAQEALDSFDPVDSKRILTTLRTASSENIWLEKRHDILFSGLYSKFTQNEPLMNYLLDSENRQLGEASRDRTWGVGMPLTDKNVLDTKFWKGENLLGKTLMEVRQDIFSSLHPSRSHQIPTQGPIQGVEHRDTQSPTSSSTKPSPMNETENRDTQASGLPSTKPSPMNKADNAETQITKK